MEHDIQVFNNPEFGEIRTICEDDTVLFCGNDVATALGYTKPYNAIATHCPYTLKRGIGVQTGVKADGTPAMQEVEMSFITESGVYRLVFGSKLPTAEKFTDWVTEEVLPSIRKHGAYMTQETLQEAFCNPDSLLKIAMALKEESDKRKALEAKNSQMEVELTIAKPKVEYYEELCDRNALTGIYETAKLLGVPPRRFTEALVKHHYLFRNKKGVLMPCEAKNNGLFEVKEVLGESNKWSGTQTLITVKGRELFRMLRLGV